MVKQSRGWCFLLHIEKSKLDEECERVLICLEDGFFKDWGFQAEVSAAGVYHLQGFFVCRVPRTFKQALSQLGFKANIQPLPINTLKKYKQEGRIYFLKENTRIEGKIWLMKDREVKQPSVLKPWFKADNVFQKFVKEDLGKQNDRQIYFYYDPVGCIGKSYFCRKYAWLNKLVYVPSTMDDATKIENYICSILPDEYPASIDQMFAIDLPRGIKLAYWDSKRGVRVPTRFGNQLGCFLENLKNGTVTEWRNRPVRKAILRPKVAVFTNNVLPDTRTGLWELTSDRIRIIDCTGFDSLVKRAEVDESCERHMDNVANGDVEEGDSEVAPF